ncbi:NAC domain-containing protein 53-like [Macadamia integrifolia]|uniref:NAC domain-containing protein 53-like n=1 Tax=Macadamia integrifolia TaxID=60698 RepID=UPI001C52B563|nr:NAC domain-containing protein 53-like [Macadamia integrifolia]
MVPAPPHQPSSTTQYPMVIPERTQREYSRSSVGHEHEHEHVFKPTDIPVGYLFEPTDEEIILCYLNKKIAEPNFRVFYIQEVDLYEFHPREIIKGCTTKDHYFFTQRKRMHQGGTRASRQTKDGSTWKATSGVQDIMDSTKSYKIGSKTTLTYVQKKPETIKGQIKTNNWIMHEFQAAEETTTSMKLSDWVICRIHEKKKKAAHDEEDDDEDLSIEEEGDDDEGDEYENLLENYLSMDVEEDCEVGEMQEEENIGTDHDQGIDNSMDGDFAKFLETYVSFDVEEEGEVMNSSMEGCIRESRENKVDEGKEMEEDLNQVVMSDFMDGGGPLLHSSLDGLQKEENNSMEGDEEYAKLLENILSTDVEEEDCEVGGERKEKEKGKGMLYDLDVGDIMDGDLSNRFLQKENTDLPSTSQQISYHHNYSYHHFPAASVNHSNTFTYGTDDMSFNVMMYSHSFTNGYSSSIDHTDLTPLPDSFTDGGCFSSPTELLPLPDSFTNGGCSSSHTELLPLPDSFTNGGCSSSHIPLPDSFKWSW